MKSYPNLMLRGRVWHYEFIRNNERYRGSTNTHLVKEAMAVLRQKIEEAESGKVPVTERKRDARIIRIQELETWDTERSQLAASHEEKDRTIRSLWKRIATYFEAVHDVTDDAMAAYARRMMLEGYSSSTIKRDLWAIRRAYAWAAPVAGLPALGPMPEIAATPKGRTKGRFVEPDDLNVWLGHLNGQTLAHAIVALATGIRDKELKRFELTWLSRAGAYAMINLPPEATKGRKPRKLPLTCLIGEVARRTKAFKTDPRSAWRTASKRADLETVAMRDLRHTFITSLAPFDPDGTRLVAGHTSGDKNAHMYYQHATTDRLIAIANSAQKAFPFLAAHASRLLAE